MATPEGHDRDHDHDHDHDQDDSETQNTSIRGSDERIAVALDFDSVLKSFERPREAFESINTWAKYVGVIGTSPQHVINGYCTKNRIDPDFFPAPDDGKLGALERAMESEMYDAERYVFVGASRRDEVVAEKAGWEYVDVDEAAEDAGWKMIR
ncbi:MAG: hypothetical protein SV253_06810 [Halobacteria archaeon]|nr:hypothetical protein [Halobacteria archaeon]